MKDQSLEKTLKTNELHIEDIYQYTPNLLLEILNSIQ